MQNLRDWLHNQRENDSKCFVSKFHAERILDWCESKNITVEVGLGAECIFYDDRNLIILNSKIRPWKRFCMMFLHECGHAMIKWRKNNEFELGYHAKESRTKLHRVFVMVEEVEAWRSARKLGIKLGIPFTKRDFDKEMSNALHSYCSWVVSPESFGKHT